MTNGPSLAKEQYNELYEKLRVRFEKNTHRHTGVEWVHVRQRLEAVPDKLWSRHKMEESDGGNHRTKRK